MGPRGVITMGGLPEGTPTGGCKLGRGGGGRVGLSWGLGVGILSEEEEDGEQTATVSEGDVVEEVEGVIAVQEEGPPGDGALRRSSVNGVPQDSGVSNCTPLHSILESPPAPCPGLHSAPGSAAWVSL